MPVRSFELAETRGAPGFLCTAFLRELHQRIPLLWRACDHRIVHEEVARLYTSESLMHHFIAPLLFACAIGGSPVAVAVVIPTVPVGNPGNSADAATG